MKRTYYWAILLAVLTLCACEDKKDMPGKSEKIFYKNYIQIYFQGKLELLRWAARPPEMPENPETYPIPRFFIDLDDVKEISPYSKYADEYERLAARNGDTSFNSWEDYSYGPPPCAFADNFQSLHVTSNADWDVAHPAGTPLDDILQIFIFSHAGYIRSGYKESTDINRDRLISELTPADMEVVQYDRPALTVYFTSTPTIETLHTLTVTLTTVEGEVKTASLTCTPEVEVVSE